jgi:hypothetical protein
MPQMKKRIKKRTAKDGSQVLEEANQKGEKIGAGSEKYKKGSMSTFRVIHNASNPK